MSTHAVSRREILAAAGAGAALVLPGCGSGAGGVFGGSAGDPAVPGTAAGMVYSGALVVTDASGTTYEVAPEENRVAQVGADGSVAWESDPGSVDWPTDVAFDSAGTVCVANLGSDTVSSFAPDGTFLGEVGRPGTGSGEFHRIRGIAFDARDLLYACDSLNHRVQVIDGTGTAVGEIGGLGSDPGEFNRPKSLAFDASGNLHVLDTGNARLQVFDPGGPYLYEYGGYGEGAGQFLQAQDFVIQEDDRVLVVDPALARIVVFEDAGSGRVSHIQLVDEEGTRLSPLRISLGPNGEIYLTVQSGAAAAPAA